MTKPRLLALSCLVSVGIAIAIVFFHLEPVGSFTCDEVELLGRAISPDGQLSAEHRMGVCDGGKTIQHTLEIVPSKKGREDRVIGAVLIRTQDNDANFATRSIQLELRWLENDLLEVGYPMDVPVFPELFELSGVRVVGRRDS